jgi:hypothetical protein
MEEDRDFDRFIELFKFGNPANIWREIKDLILIGLLKYTSL